MNWVFVRGYAAWTLAQSDTVTDVNGPFDAIYTGSGGNIKVRSESGQDVVITAAAAGVVLPIAFTRCWTTGTAATGVLGLKVPGSG